MWELEIIGIKTPSDTPNKEEHAIEAKKLFLQAVKVDKNGRYVVHLPWIDGHLLIPTNYKMAGKRLINNVSKLKKQGVFELYDYVFAEWERGGHRTNWTISRIEPN